jgi:predicted phosphodiesterase
VLAEVERENVDAIVFGGDLFLGPQPAETASLVRSVEATFVRGNCDREPDDWTLSKLDDETVAWSQGWPLTFELEGVLYCHAAPQDDMRPILTEASPPERFEAALQGVETRLVVAGHTHMQFRRDRWVNAGAVGWPYEDDVAAFWALVSDDVEFCRTAFDVERAASEILASGWPDAESFVAENIRTPPSRAEAIEYFEAQA